MLVSLPDLLARARSGAYAIGYFEAWDSYSLEAVVEAAEAECSPVIVGFGCMMVDATWLNSGGITAVGRIGCLAAARANVPVSFLLNEAHTYEQAVTGMDAGFNAVMLDTSSWPEDEATSAVSRLVREAHGRGVAVEAELGRLPDATRTGIDDSGAALTDPERAALFMARTGADCLAVSIGNVHLLYGGTASVDLERLAAIHARVPAPLVIHGGTGFPRDAVGDAVVHGVAKFNVGTVLKTVFLDGLRGAVPDASDGYGVHALIGSHKDTDILVAGKDRMRAVVRDLMRLYGSSGRATAG
jgi:ketose-bisphosphate aldolase